jgi:hypothetical protein
MRSALRVLAAAAALSACGDEPCFQEILDDHRAELVACEAGDECVVPVEDAQCACFGAYNARQQELWDELRSGSRCVDCPHGFCPEQVNPRCEAGECRTDNAFPVVVRVASPPGDVPGCAARRRHRTAR